MIFETKAYTIEPIIDFSEKLEKDSEIIALSVDSNGINTIIIHSASKHRTDDEMFAEIKSEQPKDYIFFRHDFKGNELFKTVIKDEYFNFNNVNHLPTNEILLICNRSSYKSETEFDKNARIYDSNGKFLRDFVVGDGIKDVKVDANGNIWTSYSDEGVFGNYGWDDPIVASGLVCWNKEGDKIWDFEPIRGLDEMAACYAMNIDSENNTWFSYYTGFPLVKLSNSKQIKFWKAGIYFPTSLNISDNGILMAGRFDGNYGFSLFDTNGKRIKELKNIEFQSKEGLKLNTRNYISSFGSNISFLKNKKIYLTNMDEIK